MKTYFWAPDFPSKKKTSQLEACSISYRKEKTSRRERQNPYSKAKYLKIHAKDGNGLESYSHGTGRGPRQGLLPASRIGKPDNICCIKIATHQCLLCDVCSSPL